MLEEDKLKPGDCSNADSKVLGTVFTTLFGQLMALILASFIFQIGIVFVVRFYFGLDYREFHYAAHEWMHNVDPYTRGVLFTPPSSLLVGLMFGWLPFESARFMMFILNIALLFLALRCLVIQFELSRINERFLYGIALLFYPCYFLVERGNLDGIMFALIVMGFASSHHMVKSVCLGASLAVKVYSGLIFLVLFRKRKWKVASIGVLVFILLQIPFAKLFPHFVSSVLGRTGLIRLDENISPATLFSIVIGGLWQWKVVFIAFWFGTLAYRMVKDKSKDVSKTWTLYIPWMISFPVLVYPYSGVLALALIARIASACQTRLMTRAESLIVAGFCLLGFQAVAWTYFLGIITPYAPVSHLICALGNLFMIIGACGLPDYEDVSVRSA
ncbi:MAG: DUF2029 domain-containing protein [Opitutales bacterium]|nr:DUF2029 domain-containing protein [Opitutales bacterium]